MTRSFVLCTQTSFFFLLPYGRDFSTVHQGFYDYLFCSLCVVCVCTFVFYDYVFLLRKIYHCTALFPGHPGLTFYESFHVGLFFLFLGGRYPARVHSSCLTFNPARFGWADHHHAIRFDKLLVSRLNTSIWSLYTVFLCLILFFFHLVHLTLQIPSTRSTIVRETFALRRLNL